MLLAIPRNVLAWNYAVWQGDETVAKIDMAWFRDRAEVSLGGRHYAFSRESVWQGTYALRLGEHVLARAQKRGFFRTSYDVEFAGSISTLTAVSSWRWELHNGALTIGRIFPQAWYRWTAVIDLPDGLELPEQVFLFWLVLVQWRREANSNSG